MAWSNWVQWLNDCRLPRARNFTSMEQPEVGRDCFSPWCFMDPAECVKLLMPSLCWWASSQLEIIFLAIREALYICPRFFTGNVLIEGVTLSAIGWANNWSEPCQFSFVADKFKEVGFYNPVSFLHALSSANEVFPLPFLSFSFNIWILQGCDVLWLFYSSLIFYFFSLWVCLCCSFWSF